MQPIIKITCYLIQYKPLMIKSEQKELASAILDVFVPTKFESKYLQKTKALSNSKSAKVMPTLLTIENAFKKAHKKVEPTIDLNNKRAKQQINKQHNFHSKFSSIPQKADSDELNKFIRNGSNQGNHNPEQFFVRNQLFEKQKQLKLQFERRKQLYGITNDLKFKPNLIAKQGQQAKNQEIIDNQQKSKSYKEMYQKKYGKFKIYGCTNKKKVKNYEELMKESIARFQQKFKGLGSTQQNNQNHQDHQNIKTEQDIPLLKISPFQKKQPQTSQKAQINKPSIKEVDEKIKFLMQKLHVQDEFNDSIDSISSISRIQLNCDAKGSQLNSSNIFNKGDNQISIKDQQLGFQVASQICGHSLINLDKNLKKQEGSNPFISSLSYIINNAQKPLNQQIKGKQLAGAQDINSFIQEVLKQSAQQNSELKNVQESQKVKSQDQVKIKQQQLQNQHNILPVQQQQQAKSIEFSSKIQLKQSLLQIKQSQRQSQLRIEIKIQEEEQIFEAEDEITTKQQKNIEQDIMRFEDIQISNQFLARNNSLLAFSFGEIHYPKVKYFILTKIEGKKEQKGITYGEINGFNSKIPPIIIKPWGSQQRNYSIDKKQQRQTRENAQHPQNLQEQDSSQDYQYSTQIQSFVDLNGKFIQDALVEVQNFGYCRFLAIEEQSERLSQDSYQ